MSGDGSIQRSKSQSAADTLRWGDTQLLTFLLPGGGATAPAQFSRQLTSAHWPWPVAWQWLNLVDVAVDPSETAAIISFSWEITVGVGQAKKTFYTPVANVAPPYPALLATVFPGVQASAQRAAVDFDTSRFMPSVDLQIRALVGVSSALTTTQLFVEVSSFVAPYAETHAPKLLLEHWDKEGSAGMRQDGWMPPGFTPEELGYFR